MSVKQALKSPNGHRSWLLQFILSPRNSQKIRSRTLHRMRKVTSNETHRYKGSPTVLCPQINPKSSRTKNQVKKMISLRALCVSALLLIASVNAMAIIEPRFTPCESVAECILEDAEICCYHRLVGSVAMKDWDFTNTGNVDPCGCTCILCNARLLRQSTMIHNGGGKCLVSLLNVEEPYDYRTETTPDGGDWIA